MGTNFRMENLDRLLLSKIRLSFLEVVPLGFLQYYGYFEHHKVPI